MVEGTFTPNENGAPKDPVSGEIFRMSLWQRHAGGEHETLVVEAVEAVALY